MGVLPYSLNNRQFYFYLSPILSEVGGCPGSCAQPRLPLLIKGGFSNWSLGLGLIQEHPFPLINGVTCGRQAPSHGAWSPLLPGLFHTVLPTVEKNNEPLSNRVGGWGKQAVPKPLLELDGRMHSAHAYYCLIVCYQPHARVPSHLTCAPPRTGPSRSLTWFNLWLNLILKKWPFGPPQNSAGATRINWEPYIRISYSNVACGNAFSRKINVLIERWVRFQTLDRKTGLSNDTLLARLCGWKRLLSALARMGCHLSQK